MPASAVSGESRENPQLFTPALARYDGEDRNAVAWPDYVGECPRESGPRDLVIGPDRYHHVFDVSVADRVIG